MKVAILLLAHKNEAQLRRLIGALRHENVDIFVHLDKKASFSKDALADTGVIFTENQLDVGLFEFSMVEAEKELIHTAKNHGKYDYFVLLSGQCYPLVSMESLVKTLQEQYPKPLIEIVAPTQTNYVKKNFRHVTAMKRFKLQTYAFLKKHFSYKGYRALRYIPGGFTWVMSGIKELFVGSPKARLDKMGIATYCGSQWWILPDTVIDRMEKFFTDKAFCRIVSDCFSSDETFFQTAIMAQQEENGVCLDENGNYMQGQWFFIFDGGHPILLNQEYFAQITQSGMLFARKFDTDYDTQILDSIDRFIGI